MTTRTDAIREALARPQRPDPRVVELLEELGQVYARVEELKSMMETAPGAMLLWLERMAPLEHREAEITAELEQLVQVPVDPEVLT